MNKETFGKTIEILPKEFGNNRLLKGDIITPSFKQQLKELREFYYDN